MPDATRANNVRFNFGIRVEIFDIRFEFSCAAGEDTHSHGEAHMTLQKPPPGNAQNGKRKRRRAGMGS